MDLFILIKEHFALLVVFIAIISGSLLLLFVTWKRRANLPKVLSMAITTICIVLVIAGLYGMIFLLFFGYNA